jgi:hypothetical protein
MESLLFCAGFVDISGFNGCFQCAKVELIQSASECGTPRKQCGF